MIHKINTNLKFKAFFPNSLFYLLLLSALAFVAFHLITAKASDKTVYVTIDDGPLLGFNNILAVAKQEKVPVSIFLVGLHIEARSNGKQLLKRAKDNPYVFVGNHSYSHAHNHYQLFYSDADVVVKDMQKNSRILGMTKPPIYSRLPGRDVFRLPHVQSDDPFISEKERKKERIDFDAAYENGFYLYGWDLEWSHETNGTPVQSVKKLMEQITYHLENKKTEVPNHLLLLMHDEMFADHLNGKENLTALFKALKKSGYKLKTVDQYPAAQQRFTHSDIKTKN